MLDKNLTQQQLNIQLEKAVIKVLTSSSNSSLRTAVPASPTCNTLSKEVEVRLPRTFRELRALSIAVWFFPEESFWEVLLSLKERNFSWLSFKQKLELNLLLTSKEICFSFLFWTERYTGNEIFGNFLNSDLKEALRSLLIREKYYPRPKRKVRHRGYRDKGSLRPSHRWLEKFDYTLTEEQLKLERRTSYLKRTTLYLQAYLLQKTKIERKQS